MIEPSKSAVFGRFFKAYNRRLLHSHFNRIFFDGDVDAMRGDGQTPLLICASHSSWWDPLLGLLLDDLLPNWDSYGVMDERQLRRYPFFRRLGLMGVDRMSLHGAREFVNFGQTLLEGKPRALWLTPQGEFTSNDSRPVRFQPGLGVLARRLTSCYVATVVFDYEFWSEKRPEAFISVRPIERVEVNPDFDRRRFVQAIELSLEDHLDCFARRRKQRNPALFRSLLGNEGRGQSHGSLVTPRWRERRVHRT